MTVERLVAEHDGIRLAGSLWRPSDSPRALLVMYPGSGPSDRDNDELFPPIRAALLNAGVAVCSFDKRGVGGSSGSWLDAGIGDQARDLLAELRPARAAVPGVPTGIFGHSQGGWVVLDAASRSSADFVITNSGPAVTPREQETYSTEQRLRRAGWDEAEVHAGMVDFATVMDLTTLPFETGWPRAQALPLVADLIAVGAFIPTEPGLWSLCSRIMDYDPVPALRSIRVPILALHGEQDTVVPVRRSADVFRAKTRPGLLDLRVLPGGDHRMQDGDAFVPGYLQAITAFVSARFRPAES